MVVLSRDGLCKGAERDTPQAHQAFESRRFSSRRTTLWLDNDRADHPTLIVRIAVEDTVIAEGAGGAENHTLHLSWLQVSRIE
jgi:hypothetical protein